MMRRATPLPDRNARLRLAAGGGPQSHAELRRGVRERLESAEPALRVIAEDVLAGTSRIDFVCTDEAGRISIVLIADTEQDLALFTKGLAHSAWVGARIGDWAQLAPGLGLALDGPVEIMLLAQSFHPETLAAAAAAGPGSVRLLRIRAAEIGGPPALQLEVQPLPADPATPRPAREAPESAASARANPTTLAAAGKGDAPPKPTFRTGLSEQDLLPSSRERREFD